MKRFLREHERPDLRYAAFVSPRRFVELFPLSGTRLPYACRQLCEPIRASKAEIARAPRAKVALLHVPRPQSKGGALEATLDHTDIDIKHSKANIYICHMVYACITSRLCRIVSCKPPAVPFLQFNTQTHIEPKSGLLFHFYESCKFTSFICLLSSINGKVLFVFYSCCLLLP